MPRLSLLSSPSSKEILQKPKRKRRRLRRPSQIQLSSKSSPILRTSTLAPAFARNHFSTSPKASREAHQRLHALSHFSRTLAVCCRIWELCCLSRAFSSSSCSSAPYQFAVTTQLTLRRKRTRLSKMRRTRTDLLSIKMDKSNRQMTWLEMIEQSTILNVNEP